MIQASNEIYQTDLVLNDLDALLDSEPPLLLLSDIADMWAEHIQSESDRRMRAWAPSATTFCSPQACKKQVHFKAQNFEADDPIGSRARRTFLFGHMIEAQIKAQLLAVGYTFEHHCAVPLPSPWKTVYGQVFVGPDGADLSVDTTPVLGYKADNVLLEIKSSADAGFDRMCKEGVQSASSGYYDQCQLAMLGFDSDTCLMLVQNKNTAHMAEFWILRDELRIAELTDLMLDTQEVDARELQPDFALQPYTKYHPGKPTRKSKVFEERVNTKGVVYGWDELLGYTIRHLECNYCDWKHQCWEPTHHLEKDTSSGKPVWYATPKE